MIKAYLTAMPSPYEGEDIEVRYHILQEERSIKKESLYLDYVKPSVVSLVAVVTVLEKLEQDKEQEILVVINDASLHELLKDASTTKNGDILKMASKTKKEMRKFSHLSFMNVTKDREALLDWEQMLER